MARPTIYTPDIADTILQRMKDGMSLNEVCRGEAMPSASTVRQWALDDRDGFATRYARARELLVEHWVDEIIETADDGTNDWVTRQRPDGTPETVLDREHLERSRLRIDTRKWLLVKLLPKRYGERQQLEHSGSVSLADLVSQSFSGKDSQ